MQGQWCDSRTVKGWMDSNNTVGDSTIFQRELSNSMGQYKVAGTVVQNKGQFAGTVIQK